MVRDSPASNRVNCEGFRYRIIGSKVKAILLDQAIFAHWLSCFGMGLRSKGLSKKGKSRVEVDS